MNKKIWLLLILITLLGFAIRIYKIDKSPEGLYIDETSIGYNAYSISTTGKDEHGKFMPLFFEAFGEWKLPVYIYSVAFVQLFTGPTDLSVRLPAVIYGTLTVFFIFFWVREMLKNKFPEIRNQVGLFSAFLLSLSQWHFQFTHCGFEASAAIMFLTAGLFFFFKALNNKSLIYLILNIINFSLALYSYNSSKVVIPVLTILLFIFYFKNFKFYYWLIYFIIGVFMLFPFIKFSLSDMGMVRIKQVGIFYQSYITHPWKALVKNYLLNISPNTLFIRGEPTIISHAFNRMSLLNPMEGFFILIGILALIKKFSRISVINVVMLFFGFLPAALSTFPPHALRSTLTIPVISFISSLGCVYFLKFIKNIRIRYALTGSIVIFLLIWSVKNLYIYHNLYVYESGADWQAGVKKTALYIKNIESKYAQVYIDNNAGAKISYLWYLTYPAYIYQQSANKLALEKYIFINEEDAMYLPNNSLYINNGLDINGYLLQEIYHSNMTISNKIWLIK